MNFVPGIYSEVIDRALSPDTIVPTKSWLHLFEHSCACIKDYGK